MTAWKYNAGLALLACVVILWVASAEVTQKIFEAYKQPFVLAYVGTSLMVIYLPLSVFKDWLIELYRRRYVRMEWKDKVVDLEMQELPIRDDIVFSPTKAAETHICTARQVAKAGLYLAPLWLFTEYFSNAALAHTSVASTTILTSTSALFTLLFSTLLGQDRFSVRKLISVLVTIAGVAMTTLGSTWSREDSKLALARPDQHDILGDILGLLAAVTYGLFTVLLKRTAGHDGHSADVQKVFGFIGLFTLFGLWWLAWPLQALGIEPVLEVPASTKLDEIVLANGLVGSVLSDYFWALCIVWTTPLVATLGMSLTIPVAMLADMFVYGRRYSPIYVLGSVQVFVGFMFANLTDRVPLSLSLTRMFSTNRS